MGSQIWLMAFSGSLFFQLSENISEIVQCSSLPKLHPLNCSKPWLSIIVAHCPLIGRVTVYHMLNLIAADRGWNFFVSRYTPSRAHPRMIFLASVRISYVIAAVRRICTTTWRMHWLTTLCTRLGILYIVAWKPWLARRRRRTDQQHRSAVCECSRPDERHARFPTARIAFFTRIYCDPTYQPSGDSSKWRI